MTHRWLASGILATGLSGLSLAALGGGGTEGGAATPRGMLIPVPQEVAEETTPAVEAENTAASELAAPESEVPQDESYRIRQHTHQRLRFERDIERVAVGGEHILDIEVLNTRELLALGLQPGTTTALIWFSDGELEQIEVTVTQDLSLLEAVLADIHPGILVQKAPDREALVLTGMVPRAIYSRRAEDVARSWLNASSPERELLVGDAARQVEDAQSMGEQDRRRRGSRADGAVINLIRVEDLPEFGQPMAAEEQILAAIKDIGGEKVTVRRVQKGPVPDDEIDILVLEGEVHDQIALVRVLSLAYKVYVGNVKGPDVQLTDGVTQTTRVFEGDDLAIVDDLVVIADEAGALVGITSNTQQDNVSQDILRGFGRAGGGGGLGGGGGGGRGVSRMGLDNRVEANIARASAIELADGRILSFIDVTDLPQVRVDIRVYEVNRTKLLAYESDLAVITSDFDQGGLNPAAGATTVQGDSAARVGSSGAQDIQNVFGFLGGTITNQLQVSGSSWAVDSLLGFLESEGVARSLANPSLAVLSGELALFQVGGMVPIDESFGTQIGIQGVFNTTRFIEFGVNLAVRPLVGEGDFITIDFAPEVTTPDAVLTQLLIEATGSNPNSFAFETRLLKTSARLLDGDTLLVGGLSQTGRSDQDQKAPWLSQIPLLGLLFQGFNYSDDDLEVVVMIRPTIVRDPLPDAALWSYPSIGELLGAALPKRPEPEPAPEPEPGPGDQGPAQAPEETGAPEGGSL